MKYSAIPLLLIACATAASCHKSHSASPNIAPANVANSIDSAAVAAQLKADGYSGIYTEYEDYGSFVRSQKMVFSLVHVVQGSPGKQGMAIFKSSMFLPVPTAPSGQYVVDTIPYTGPGAYGVNGLSFRLGKEQIGDSLFVSWRYTDPDIQPDIADRYCTFVGIHIDSFT